MCRLIRLADVRYQSAQDNWYRAKGKDEIHKEALIQATCFDLQQAIEFYLKGLVELFGDTYIVGHDIRAQLGLLSNIEYELHDTFDAIRQNGVTISGWEEDGRYDNEFTVTDADIEIALDICENLKEFAQKQIIIKERNK